jgi:hypothetical protein
MSAIAILQVERSIYTAAYLQFLKEMLLHNCIPPFAITIFSQSTTSSMQLFLSNVLCNCISALPRQIVEMQTKEAADL